MLTPGSLFQKRKDCESLKFGGNICTAPRKPFVNGYEAACAHSALMPPSSLSPAAAFAFSCLPPNATPKQIIASSQAARASPLLHINEDFVFSVFDMWIKSPSNEENLVAYFGSSGYIIKNSEMFMRHMDLASFFPGLLCTDIDQFMAWLKNMGFERKYLDGPTNVYITEHSALAEWKALHHVPLRPQASTITEPHIISTPLHMTCEQSQLSQMETYLLDQIEKLSSIQGRFSKSLHDVTQKTSQLSHRVAYLESLAYEHVRDDALGLPLSSYEHQPVRKKLYRLNETSSSPSISTTISSSGQFLTSSRLDQRTFFRRKKSFLASSFSTPKDCFPEYNSDGLLCTKFGRCKIICNPRCFSGPPIVPDMEDCSNVPSCGTRRNSFNK